MDAEQFVNVSQACAIAGVCRRTIYYWHQRGRLEVKRTAGGSLRIRAGSLFRETAPTSDGGSPETLTAPVNEVRALEPASSLEMKG